MRRVPPQAIALATRYEGLHRQLPDGRIGMYICPAGFPTVGYGHLCPADQAPVTREQCETWLAEDLAQATQQALTLCPVLLQESDARLAAIVDFVFNLGATRLRASTLRRRVNAGQWGEAAYELQRWVHGGGKVLHGLVLRRRAAARLLERAQTEGTAWQKAA